MNYVAIGDSLTVGIGALGQGGFVSEYKRLTELTVQQKIYVQKFARNGLTSDELAHFFQSLHFQQAIMNANIITISIGGNDLIQANRYFIQSRDSSIFNKTLLSLTSNLWHILETIRNLKNVNGVPYLIRVIGIYNPYPELPHSHYWVNTYNRHLNSIVSNYGTFVNIYHLFLHYGKALLAVDRLHPNALGHRLIAQELYKSGFRELTTSKKALY